MLWFNEHRIFQRSNFITFSVPPPQLCLPFNNGTLRCLEVFVIIYRSTIFNEYLWLWKWYWKRFNSQFLSSSESILLVLNQITIINVSIETPSFSYSCYCLFSCLISYNSIVEIKVFLKLRLFRFLTFFRSVGINQVEWKTKSIK